MTNVDRTISSVKRHMGTDWTTEIDGKKYTPQEISARILMKLKGDAEAFLNDKVTDAVITVPAYFNDAERQATKEAGEIAGLNVLRIVNEPTAAALAYGLDKKGIDQKVLVFDLGGGTFDVSLLDLADGVVEVLATNGDNHLGGDDWDQRVIDWMADKFQQENGIDLRKDPMALQRLKEAAENAKKELSSAQQADINLPFITADASGPKHLNYTLTRAEFERITRDLLDRCKEPVTKALRDANLQMSDVNEVILVGGSSRMPAVQELVKQMTGKQPNMSVNPDRGLPTAADNQTSVEINVLQGEREMARDNKSLGKFNLTGIPAAPRGVPQIEVTFDIDANGIVKVTAKDKGTGKQQQITISGSTALSDDEVDRMVKDAESHAEEDKKRKEDIEVRNQTDSLCYSTEQTLKDLGDKVSEDQKKEVQAAIDETKKALDGTDIDAIKAAGEKLQEASHKLAEVVYSDAQAQTAQGSSQQPSGSASNGDDVVDADYEVVDDDKDNK